VPQLPGGTVTFAFTDIEGSTRLLQELGDEVYATVSADHRRIVRAAFGEQGGTEIDTQGDAFFYSFARSRDAATAAVDAQRALRRHPWPDGKEVRVRMGLHTGEPHLGDEGYLGIDVVRAARIAAVGHGGQILVSETTRALLGNQLPEGVAVHDLGEQTLKDIQHEHIFELAVDGRSAGYKPSSVLSAKPRSDDFSARFEERIQGLVERHLARAFGEEVDGAGVSEVAQRQDDPSALTRLALGGLGIAFAALAGLILIAALVVVLVRFVF
jgi:class 3 adenylate cyclase